jgi:glycerol-3-phosphate acyltransferase PlsY
MMEDILLYIGAYLLGTVPVSKFCKGKRKAAFWTRFGLDILKGAIVVTIAHAGSPHDEPDWVLAGFLAILGDRFPFHSKFKSDASFGTTVGAFAGVIGLLLTR